MPMTCLMYYLTPLWKEETKITVVKMSKCKHTSSISASVSGFGSSGLKTEHNMHFQYQYTYDYKCKPNRIKTANFMIFFQALTFTV